MSTIYVAFGQHLPTVVLPGTVIFANGCDLFRNGAEVINAMNSVPFLVGEAATPVTGVEFEKDEKFDNPDASALPLVLMICAKPDASGGELALLGGEEGNEVDVGGKVKLVG